MLIVEQCSIRAARRRKWFRGLLPLAFSLGLACQGDHLSRPSAIPDDVLYWALDFDHHAVTLSTTAPYDTLTVLAVPRNVAGQPLADLPVPQYTSTDIEHVAVTSDGVLLAVAPTPTNRPVLIVATLTYNNLKHVDTMAVQVVDEPNPPVLASLSVHPVPPDSAKVAASSIGPSGHGGGGEVADTLPLQMTAMGGAALPPPLVYFRASDTTIVRLVGAFSGIVYGHRPGTINIYASTTVFGVTKEDTLQYRIGLPIRGFISITSPFNSAASSGASPDTIPAHYGFSPSEVTIGVGGVVQWSDQEVFTRADGSFGVIPADIEFTDADLLSNVLSPYDSPYWTTTPDVVFGGIIHTQIWCDIIQIDCGAGGFVLDFAHFGFAERVFARPGVYHFHSSVMGKSGFVTVVDER